MNREGGINRFEKYYPALSFIQSLEKSVPDWTFEYTNRQNDETART